MRSRRIQVLTGCFPLVLAACGPEAAPPRPRPSAELSAAALRAASYASQYVESGEVRLVNGIFEDSARRVMVFFQPEYAAGDLDADGSIDAAVVLSTTTGGSGTFQDLVVVRNQVGEPVHAATFFLGDRVPVDRIRIVDGEIQLDLTMHGPADPMCCPSERATRRFELLGDQLVEIDTPAEATDGAP